MKNYYKTLGIDSKSSSKDIRKIYRVLAKKYHPDKNHKENATQIFISLHEAFRILSDAKKRKEYDRLYEQALNQNDYDYKKSKNEEEVEVSVETIEKDIYLDEFDNWVKEAKQEGMEFSLKPLKKVLRFIFLSPFYIIGKTVNIVYKITFYLFMGTFIIIFIFGFLYIIVKMINS